MITYETRKEADQSVDRIIRRQQILKILEEYGPLTAKQIAVLMHQKGFTNNDDRNNAAPRLTEMTKLGMVEAIRKEKCIYTGKTVAVFARKRVDQQQTFLN